ncbi:uncharacterized protein [Rutidosis leptorrhynchoides]|uniref:uncharacterized protein n=1 Tax=Rutidosis leptorrhynchoides TaxID=125765 RepID=UPI003A9946E9
MCQITSRSTTYNFTVTILIKLQNLEAITIEKCQLIREVFDLEGLTSSGEVDILSRLRELTLSDLPSLGCIWNKNPRRALCFRNLRALKVRNCENLRFLFSSSVAKALGQIKEIEITSCKLMEEIIDAQEEELEEAVTSDTLEFPLLISLSLEELPNLKTFCYQKHRIHCPSLTKLTISQCPKMMTFSSLEAKQWSITSDRVLFPSLEELKLFSMCQLKKIWHSQLHEQSFRKLASLTVELCENLSHVFPSNSMDRLQSLNKIEVVGCPSLETLFDPVSLSFDEMQKPLVLSSLEKMKLLNLPRLADILKSDCKLILAFPSLWEVSVRRCHSLSHLFSSATARTLDKLTVLDVSSCNNMKGIIVMEEGTVKTVETFKFGNLSTLKLGDLENLICFNSKSCAGDGSHPLFDDKTTSKNQLSLCHEFLKFRQIAQNVKLIRLQNLEAITIERCQLIREVFDLEELTTSGDVKILWQLTRLTLSGLPRLVRIWNKNPRRALCFQNLKALKVQNCKSLRFLFSSYMAKALVRIKEIEIVSCALMEEIMYVQEEELEETMTTDTIEFPLLTSLSLEELPNLKTFSCGKYYIHCPSLTRLTISGCPKMMTFLHSKEDNSR